MIQWENITYVIDCGPDFRQQMLNTNCKRLDGIIYTHEHADHTMGLDDIRPFFFRQGNIPIYGHQRVLDALASRFAYIFETKNKYPGAPGVVPIPISNTPFTINGLTVIPVEGFHNKLQVFGYRFNDFAYLTDMKTLEDNEIKKLENLDVLVINALRIKSHVSHFNLEEALNFISLVQPKKAYLTHISHLLGFHNEVEELLPNNVSLAYDGLEIELPH